MNLRDQFNGRENDNAIGLTYYRARWYSSELGRFVSEDPIGFGGGAVEGQLFCDSVKRLPTKMTKLIIRTKEEKAGDLFRQQIFGLNTFRINDVSKNCVDDLELNFLKQICATNETTILTGNLHDFAEKPVEIFGSHDIFDYDEVRIGFYGGEFYDSEEWSSFPPLVFAKQTLDFFELRDTDELLMPKFLYADAVAFFVSPLFSESHNFLKSLLSKRFDSADTLKSKACDLYELVLLTVGDSNYFEVYSKNLDSYNILTEPISNATSKIENSYWFKANIDNLVWDGEYNMCLVDK